MAKTVNFYFKLSIMGAFHRRQWASFRPLSQNIEALWRQIIFAGHVTQTVLQDWFESLRKDATFATTATKATAATTTTTTKMMMMMNRMISPNSQVAKVTAHGRRSFSHSALEPSGGANGASYGHNVQVGRPHSDDAGAKRRLAYQILFEISEFFFLVGTNHFASSPCHVMPCRPFESDHSAHQTLFLHCQISFVFDYKYVASN